MRNANSDLDKVLETFADDFEELLEGFSKRRSNCGCSCEEKIIDENAESLKKDYRECMEWAFGEMESITSKIQGRNLWEKRHPELPVPRILKVGVPIPDAFGVVSMIIDVYPLYLKFKERGD